MVEFNGWICPWSIPARRNHGGAQACSPVGDLRVPYGDSARRAYSLAAVQHISMNDARAAGGRAERTLRRCSIRRGPSFDDVIVHIGGRRTSICSSSMRALREGLETGCETTRGSMRVDHLSGRIHADRDSKGPRAVDCCRVDSTRYCLPGNFIGEAGTIPSTQGQAAALPFCLHPDRAHRLPAEDGFEIYIPPTNPPASGCGTRFLEAARSLVSARCGWVLRHKPAAGRQAPALWA